MIYEFAHPGSCKLSIALPDEPAEYDALVYCEGEPSAVLVTFGFPDLETFVRDFTQA